MRGAAAGPPDVVADEVPLGPARPVVDQALVDVIAALRAVLVVEARHEHRVAAAAVAGRALVDVAAGLVPRVLAVLVIVVRAGGVERVPAAAVVELALVDVAAGVRPRVLVEALRAVLPSAAESK